MEVALVPHPSAPGTPVEAIGAEVDRSAATLALRYRIVGDLTRVLVPPRRPAAMGRDLWRHTCCEAFLALDGAAAYHEFNFAPSGEWTVYAFRGYRDGAPLDDPALAPGIACREATGALVLEARIPLARLSPAHPGAVLRLGLATVVETRAGAHTYWALAHPRPVPDFHDAGGFALRLEPAAAE